MAMHLCHDCSHAYVLYARDGISYSNHLNQLQYSTVTPTLNVLKRSREKHVPRAMHVPLYSQSVRAYRRKSIHSSST